nr:tRNA lysidine(34) synthetase TilS [Methylopila capsulata]
MLTPAFAEVNLVLIAVSGGADSMALLALAADWAATRTGTRLSVATVDHSLRPESAAEARAVALAATALGLPHARLEAPLGRGARVEETARDARYAALSAHAAAIGAEALATAHTLDDQAETVLMRLAAGSGPAGLAAMRPKSMRGRLVHLRPLLGVPKARLVATLRARGWGWSEDAMNADPAFCRARLRASRAVLADEGLTAERLGVFARRAARAEDALLAVEEKAAAAHLSLAPNRAVIAPEASALPAEIRLRLLARAVAALGAGRVRLDRLERLFERTSATASGAATLAGARVAWTVDGRIVVTAAPPRRDVASEPKRG